MLDWGSPRDFLNFNNSIATFRTKSMFDMVLGEREGGGGVPFIDTI